MTPCPSDLKLERYLLDPAASPLAGHVAACPPCQERIAEMEKVGAEFRALVFPATVERVVEAAAPRRPLAWLMSLAPFPALAGAAAALFLMSAPQPDPDYTAIKGAEIRLSVFAQVAGAVRAVADGDRVPAGAALRFQVQPTAPCRLWIVSVDGTGQVSRLYPADGDAGAPLSGSGPLPGGAVLDGRNGPERIYAVCTRASMSFAEVERAVRASAVGGIQAVRAGMMLRGLPAGALQATLLLEKSP
jgi:hypothetical protein